MDGFTGRELCAPIVSHGRRSRTVVHWEDPAKRGWKGVERGVKEDSPAEDRIELPWRARKAVSLFPRLATRIESWKLEASWTDRSHLDFHREILDAGSELLEPPWHANGIPVCAVIVRDIYDRVQSSFSSLSD